MKDVKQNYDIPLHDIKPIVDIEEYSLYYFLGYIAIGVIIATVFIYFIYRWYKKRNRFNIRSYHKELFDSVDINETKKAAYLITTCAHTFKNDSDEHQKAYRELIARLEEFKYRKSVDKFDEKTIGFIETYKSMIHV